jgi:hypothetical protein
MFVGNTGSDSILFFVMLNVVKLESLARDKHSSILNTFVYYGRIKFYNIEPLVCIHDT